jgi:hypothetical protein
MMHSLFLGGGYCKHRTELAAIAMGGLEGGLVAA